MKNYQSHFRFNKQERSGIFYLLLIIVLLQIGYFVFKSFPRNADGDTLLVDSALQAQIDTLKGRALRKESNKTYPFNPNFITDYKGYILGMSVAEIDRLHAFRAGNNFVNSPEEFQQVTMVSDSLLRAMSPQFKFPEWTKKNRRSISGTYETSQTVRGDSDSFDSLAKDSSTDEVIADLNSVTVEQLRAINGIGETLSTRILKFRDRLGGFLVDEQLYDVYGLDPGVADRVLRKYKVLNRPLVRKININTSSASEISSLIYIKYAVANEMVNYRNMNGSFSSLDELRNIPDFPVEKIDRIALYLSL
ncbi:helix-hairpin-helix domain-containing protein [Flavobacteriaceae bacterium TP-CH-4]|uniref:Helix-hairpin-helix domain-containing protein n=1 Tax=Pelagihabitans pacificus TaxID=2696054 RepID=A0A967AVJ0_9FLAO|nr:helix-hairpin-helix domain-containing protein [Pelagihabitans pacificus]NHF60727.1 helix-hairpin-helix domain-containing protein [Pelagihabitans pacificus]